MKTFAKIKSGAFTLIELLAAMTITTVLVLVIVALTSRGVDIWRWVLQDVRTTTLARTAMDTMTKDFESMQFRAGNPFEWMLVQRDSDLVSRATKTTASRKKGGSSALNETLMNLMNTGPEGAKITNASQLIFFTTATDRNPAKSSMDMRNDRIIGDVNCVGYKLLYRDQILDQDATAESDGFPVYSLYRNLISAEDTVQNLLGQQDLWSAYTRYQQDETIPANFLVENVVEMTLIFEVDYQKKIGNSGSNKSDKDAAAGVVLVPVMTTGANRLGSCTQMDVYGNRLDIIGSSVNIDDLKSGRVTAVTISMTVVTDEGMALVDQIRQKKRPAPSPEEFLERYTRSFTQRVALPMNR